MEAGGYVIGDDINDACKRAGYIDGGVLLHRRRRTPHAGTGVIAAVAKEELVLESRVCVGETAALRLEDRMDTPGMMT